MLNIIKLAVGIDDFDHLAAVQQRKLADIRAADGKKKAKLGHRTRHAPRRADELLAGGSMYWVIKGRISARQRLIGFETDKDEEGRKVCFILVRMYRQTSLSGRVKRTSRRKWRRNCASLDFCENFFRISKFIIAAALMAGYIHSPRSSHSMRATSPVD